MSGTTRGKLIVDSKKFIIQIGGDNANPADFDEDEMNLIAIGPGHSSLDAVFRNQYGNIIFEIAFSHQIEISKNMLDSNFTVNINKSGETKLDSSTINQFGQLVRKQHAVNPLSKWSDI